MKRAYTEIEKHYDVKDFMTAIGVQESCPSERELDMLWKWFIVKGETEVLTKTHLAKYIADVYGDDWYLKCQDSVKFNIDGY